MHGKKREEYKARLSDLQTAAVLSEKAEQWHQLMHELAERRVEKSDEQGATTLVLLEKALIVNPDPLHLWNHRREWIIMLNKNNTTTTTGTSPTDSKEEVERVLASELNLTQAALERHPKAYGAWMHRKWTLQYCRAPVSLLESELDLTAQFLSMDERNFHCWNYRRFVVGCLASATAAIAANKNVNTIDNIDDTLETLYPYTGQWMKPSMGVQLMAPPTNDKLTSLCPIPSSLVQTEWNFTTEKIRNNFSNFSAFYYRSQLLPSYLELASDTLTVWQNEFQMIEDAVCTEPDDQTAWWYQALLLSMDDDLFPLQQLHERLLEHVELLRELLEDSPNSKWILMGLQRLLEKLHMDFEQQRQLLQELQNVDPDRAQRYQQLLDKIVD